MSKLFLKDLGKGLSSIRRYFSSISKDLSKEPSFLTLPNGEIIPYPRGSEFEVKAEAVVEYGQQAVEQYLPETNHWNKLRNTFLGFGIWRCEKIFCNLFEENGWL